MNAVEKEIYAALIELEETVQANRNAQAKTSLLPLFARLDELLTRLPKVSDPTLHHYLHRKSYEKARLHLEGRAAENQAGNCGH
jgi:hypothetical protein